MAIRRAFEALNLFVTLPIEGTVLDIGSEDGSHSRYIEMHGKTVMSLDAHAPYADIQAEWPVDTGVKYGAIWCSHTLEHSRNPGLFLDQCKKSLADGGWLAVTVPPMKDEIVGGHVTLWNAGLLLYHLILAGFNCSKAMVKTYGYNVSVIVRNRDIIVPEQRHDAGDIERLSKFFPMDVFEGFSGDIETLNWGIIE
jgi:hypothetical protein